MRKEITDNFPTLASDKKVLVTGSGRPPGLNAIKKLIGELNRKEEWIEGIFQSNFPSGSVVSSRTGLVLTLFGTGHNALVKVRNEAKERGITCLQFALNTSEVKDILRILAEKRFPEEAEKEAVAATPSVVQKVNGNGVHQDAEPPVVVQPPSARGCESNPEVTETNRITSLLEPPDESETEGALTALNDLQEVSQRVFDSVCTISDHLRMTTVERDRLKGELEEAREELLRLRPQVAALQEEVTKLRQGSGSVEGLKKENANLLKTKTELEEELVRFKTLFGQFEAMAESVKKGTKK
jgi:hypothetical protein